ncbi:MAG: chitobiase/beta-hexosaminidase C-terminal domain-containing protein [Muribaculaceae bacterium]|nr:chitobiase/beta-hexosaminidase C-terminal domain-containing protein [Muribaculaceae bacterium]
MKKLLLSLALAVISLFAANAENLYTLTFGVAENQKEVNQYNQTWTLTQGADVWSITGFSNNNNAWSDIRFGTKTASNVKEGIIVSTFPISGTMEEVVLRGYKTKSGQNDKWKNCYVETSTTSDFAETTNQESVALSSFTTASSDVTVTLTTSVTDQYVRLYIEPDGVSTNNGWFAMNSITINGSVNSQPSAVEAPVITVTPGATSYSVEITCATDEAKIYYTLDGEDPTENDTEYTQAIELTKTTTVKAIAVKGADQSRVATRVVEMPLLATSISQILEAYSGKDVEFVLTCDLTYVYQGFSGSNSYLYLTDGEDFILVFGYKDSTPTYKVGDTFTKLSGNFTHYNGLPEVKAGYTLSEATAGEEVIEPTIGNIDGFFTEENLNKYVKFKGVEISNVNGVNATMTDSDSKSVALYNRFGVPGYENGEGLTITGFVSVFNETYQLYPTSIESTQVFAPKFSLESGAYYEGTELVITCDTEGATIVYCINDGDLTEETAPVTIILTEDMSIEAYATADDMEDSDVVEAEYTIKTVEGTSAMFDFSSAEEFANIECSTDVAYPGDGANVVVDGITMTVNGVSIVLTKGTNGSAIYKNGNSLRTYNGGTMTVTCPSAYSLTKITLTHDNNFVPYSLADDQPGSLNDKGDEWTASAGEAMAVSDENITKVVLTATGTCRISNINVEFGSDTQTGIENVSAGNNGAVEYYNLQGVKVLNPSAGIYIRRQGSEATKVYVK